ncbi:MAG: hypothetical protein M1541_01055 [Acidobacteria bacterium]|nr:hypothetical protein [Acidobacteriota bacterium]
MAYGDGPSRIHPAMVLAGTTTYGTQAAAEFVTNEERVSGLLRTLNVRSRQRVPHFTVILQQKIIGGAIIESRPVLVRIQRGVPAARP